MIPSTKSFPSIELPSIDLTSTFNLQLPYLKIPSIDLPSKSNLKIPSFDLPSTMLPSKNLHRLFYYIITNTEILLMMDLSTVKSIMDLKIYGMSALFLAAIVANEEAFTFLLNLGALTDVSYRDFDNETMKYSELSLKEYCKRYNRKFFLILEEKKEDEEENIQCAICLEDPSESSYIKRKQITLQCKHKFCVSCMKKLTTSTCPLCRTSFLVNNLSLLDSLVLLENNEYPYVVFAISGSISTNIRSTLEESLYVNLNSPFLYDVNLNKVILNYDDYKLCIDLVLPIQLCKLYEEINKSYYHCIEDLKRDIIFFITEEMKTHYIQYFKILLAIKKRNIHSFFNHYIILCQDDINFFKRCTNMDDICTIRRLFCFNVKMRNQMRDDNNKMLLTYMEKIKNKYFK